MLKLDKFPDTIIVDPSMLDVCDEKTTTHNNTKCDHIDDLNLIAHLAGYCSYSDISDDVVI